MSNKQWIEKVLEHNSDAPVPYSFSLSPVARRRLEQHFDTDDVESHLNLPIRMTGMRTVKPLYVSPEEFGSEVRDEFGVLWTTSPIDRGVPVGPCITEPDLKGYSFPDPAVAYRFEHLDDWCNRNSAHFTVLWVGDLWERATFMCGMENLLLWVALETEFVDSLLAGIADYILDTVTIVLDRVQFDAIALSDDYGTQRSLVISPASWRRLVKPKLADIFFLAKSAGKKTFLHSCGNVRAVVPDLVELGLDILHPIQPEAMNILELKEHFGHQLTFCGGLGTQRTLAGGTPKDVRDEVDWLKREMGRGGGFILEPGITIQADVPLENMVAMIEAAAG